MDLQEKDLIENSLAIRIVSVQRLSTKESLEFLSKNNVEMSERTFRRYKQQILLQRNTLDKYSRQNIQLEQLQKIETKKSVLKHLWNLFENAVKISDKLSILKLIEKISDNLPATLWNANEYGKKIKIEKKMQEFNKNSIWNDP